MFNLKNKVAVVTGASRGIGKEIAKIYAKAGAHVSCVSRNKDTLNNVVESIVSLGGTASMNAFDVSNFDEFQNNINDIISEYGAIDILVNNAGITIDKLIMRMNEDDWNKVLDINLKGAFNGIKSVTRTMMKARFGRIINISSVVGLTGNSGQANYAASKAGLIGLSKASAKELSSRGITVNCIAPGYIETDMTADMTDENKENLYLQIPLGRIGSPKDIATAALFLASDEAGYITGQTITVDGGMVMN
ncbi:MAG: 3-oxoacyl-[acyl-carrier-protein] reductase [Candidatus Marinimicrobia bacterium]|jgi:3-oxoacyl-[acyl-carrier protein] reductase|nr:3-oxoacyl-[acyl-carrier-protein] reductase [Candidatus Neomarinimicrobiota bacterium]MBT4149589.1 3-oxoacyl-[acyl-carrier-protein] reductase [Candidatus Neomarinimicrobiota bacterium]MBT4317619.1 3-oxoacyl-[acyl-carrier-protein] reductase [Candidatus Neomarinimicrobiota bacterium]MBT4783873.1 3-oxoacyl-[acyl-carrier-protein] reductase [Candidatus Neomarinimicrobiota bacterium]MBT5096364.1 3-oxoacyl-[acyl-carrier-protein] reductase [Candidatus Neomarinimicrobiota bacterium]|tara:strand:+ start:15 stop:761 length:747 start_codon:yes stop_codon:yes gene_type:complete